MIEKEKFNMGRLRDEEEAARKYRGEIIEATILFESILDMVIAEYYCKPETKSMFRHKVLWTSSITLDKKIEIFVEIVAEVKGEGLADYMKPYNVTKASLRKIAEHRNKCAHAPYISLFNHNSPEKFLGFLKTDPIYKIDDKSAKDRIGKGLRFAQEFYSSIDINMIEFRKKKAEKEKLKK